MAYSFTEMSHVVRTIRIPGFVPCNFCRVLLHISPPARIAGADRIRGSVVGVRKEEKLQEEVVIQAGEGAVQPAESESKGKTVCTKILSWW